MPGNITYSIDFAASIARLVDNSAQSADAVKKMAADIDAACSMAKKALETFGVGLSIQQFSSMVMGANDAVAALGRLGIVAGTTGAVMSGFEVPARLAQTSLDSVAMSVAKLGKSMAEAQAGNVEKAGLFKALGIDPADGSDAASTLVEVGKALAGMQDQEVAGFISSQLLSKGFAELRPLMAAIAEQGGIVATKTEEQIAAAKKLQDQFTMLAVQTDESRRQLVEGMLPALSAIAGALSEAKAQGAGFVEIGEALGTGLRAVTSVVMGAVDAFVLAGKAIATFAAAKEMLKSGDLAGAVRAVGEGFEDMSNFAQTAGQRIEKVWADTAEAAKKAMKPDGADEQAIASIISENNGRNLMEFKKYYEQRLTAIKDFEATYAAAIKTGNALAAEALRSGDIGEKTYIQQVAANEQALLAVRIQAFEQEKALYHQRGDIAKEQYAKDQIELAKAAQLANQTITKARVDSLAAVSDQQWKRHIAQEVTRIQRENFTQVQLLQDGLTEKQNTIDAAEQQGLMSAEEAARQRLLLQLQYNAQMGDVVAQGELQKIKIEAMSGQQQVEFYFGTLQQMTAGAAQHNRTMFEINKAAAIANAVISTAQGAASALQWGFPMGPIFAAVMIAAGAIQIATIAGQKYGGDSASTPSLGAIPSIPADSAGVAPNASAQQITNLQPLMDQVQQQQTPQQVSLTLIGSQFSYDQVVNEIIPLMNQAAGNGVNITVTTES